MTTITGADLFDNLISHAQRTGLFESVNGHEPKSAPGTGITASFWASTVTPVAQASGLAVTSLRIEISLRLQTNMMQQPADRIDPNLIDATNAMLSEYSTDFQLDSTVMEIDLLGAYGTALGARFGYLNLDSTLYRAVVITIPVILDDNLKQGA